MNKEQQLIDVGRAKSMSEARRIVSQGAFEKVMGKTPLPELMRSYVDKYFTRARDILIADGLNPWVNMQVFIRNGPGELGGIEESIKLLDELGAFQTEGCKVYCEPDGSHYGAGQTIMNIIAPVQDIIEWETLYLGIISYRTSIANGKDLDGYSFEQNIKYVVQLADPRPVFYFGARHWHWELDSFLSALAFEHGCVDCSTDNGAKNVDKEGIGTIPHSLENIYAYYHGVENAVLKSTLAFDEHMPIEIPRIALIDYANREITDTLTLIDGMGDVLDGVRVDTCGENVMQDTVPGEYSSIQFSDEWKVKGVSVAGVFALHMAMKLQSYTPKEFKVILSSGFGKPEKIKMFNEAEKSLGIKLYDSIGAGFMDDIITATADIIAIGEKPDDVDFIEGNVVLKNVIHKVGRPPKVDESLKRRI